MYGRTRVFLALTLALSAIVGDARPARAQCVAVEHAVSGEIPEITRTVLVDHEDDWDFRALDPNDYDGELRRLFNAWTVQSFLPFSAQQMLWIPSSGGLTVKGYLDEQLIDNPQMGARFSSSYSYEPQDFSVTLRFIDDPDPLVSNTKRYVKLSVRNAGDLRHRAFGIVFRTDWNETLLGFQSQFTAVDVSDDRVPSVFEFHGDVTEPEGYMPCLVPGSSFQV